MEEERKISASAISDVNTVNIEDYVPEELIKVYPYRAVFGTKERPFIDTQSHTIVRIDQQSVTDFKNLKTDENGNLYTEMFGAWHNDTKLSIASGVSSFQKTVQKLKMFTAVTNDYIDTEDNKPDFFTIGLPFNKQKFQDGEIQVYYAPSIKATTQGLKLDLIEDGYNIDDADPMSTIMFQNVVMLEEQLDKAGLGFTLDLGFGKNAVIQDGDRNGVTMKFQSHTLLHSIKGKGKTVIKDNEGNIIQRDYGEINFNSKEKICPFKMTPISTKNKVQFFADWFDYDVVMPWFMIKEFKDGGSLSSVIKDEVDRHMVEDMIILSAGFADQWLHAPRYTLSEVSNDKNLTRSDVGKIHADYRVGHAGYSIQSLEGKQAQKVCDDVYERHLRENPGFKLDERRYQSVKSVINALSRYIYTSYAIGRGGNAFNEIYLPWYLEPFLKTSVLYDKKIEIKENIFSYVLSGTEYKNFSEIKETTVKFQEKTNYYRTFFSNEIFFKATNELVLPLETDVSNIKVIQTDRKLTIPELPQTINAIDKLPLPGDISTSSSKDLRYMFYLPIKSQKILEKIYIKSDVVTKPLKIGDRIKVQLPKTILGKELTQDEADAEVLKLYPNAKIIKKPLVKRNKKELFFGKASFPLHYRFVLYKDDPKKRGFESFKLIESKSEDIKVTASPKRFSYDSFIDGRDVFRGWDWRVYKDNYFRPIAKLNLKWGEFFKVIPRARYTRETYEVYYSEFDEAIVEITKDLGKDQTFSYQNRQLIFDKQNWRSFLNNFGIINSGFETYNLLEKENFVIDELDEIIISYVWGDECRLALSGSADYIIKLNNAEEESITEQRIRFY